MSTKWHQCRDITDPLPRHASWHRPGQGDLTATAKRAQRRQVRQRLRRAARKFWR